MKELETIYVDMDDTICDYKSHHAKIKAIHEMAWPQSMPGFFLHLKPLPNAIESLKELEKHFEVCILTRPSVLNLHCYSEKAEWVRDHLGEEWLERLYLAPNKSKHIGHYLIDDAIGFGQEEFNGMLIRFGSKEFPNWKTIMEFFRK
jgi:5'-nucleotidase